MTTATQKVELSHLRDISFNYVFDGNPSSRITMVDEIDIRTELWYPEKGQVVFDVGAGYGSYSLPAAASGAEVYAFEPFPDLQAPLQSNIEANKFTNLHLVNYGLGAKEEVLHRDIYQPMPAIDMQIRPLDAVFKELNLKRLDWLKVDTEGMEIAVLEGGRATIRRHHPKLILEIHTFMPGVELGRAIEMVAELGYQEIKQRDRAICRMLYAGMLR